MKRFLLLILFILSSSPLVNAGLGETETQLAERYGQPLYVKPGSVPDSIWRSYRFQQRCIDVQFVEGVSQEEQTRPKTDGRFSVADVKAFLQTSVLKGNWEDLVMLNEPDVEGGIVQQGIALREGQKLVGLASVSTFFVAVQSIEYLLRRTHIYPGGNISRAGWWYEIELPFDAAFFTPPSDVTVAEAKANPQ